MKKAPETIAFCLSVFTILNVTIVPIQAQSVYAASTGSGTILVIDSSSRSLTGVIFSGLQLSSLALAPDAKYLYAVDATHQGVIVFDTSTNTQSNDFSAPGCISEIAISPDGGKAYLSTPCTNGLTIVDLVTFANSSIVFGTNLPPHGSQGGGIAVSPDGSKVYVGEPLGLGVYDTATGAATLVQTIQNFGTPCFVNELAITPDGKQLFATGCEVIVAALDTATFTPTHIGSIPCTSGGVAITPDGKKAYVADKECGPILDINTATHTATSFTLPDTNTPLADYIAFASDGSQAFASGTYCCIPLNGAGHVLVLNPSNDTEIADIQPTPAPGLSYATTTGIAVMPMNNTPAGTNVAVSPVDKPTNTSPVTLTFSTVSQAGFTSLFISSNGPAPPAGFTLGSPAAYYDLATTALYTSPITVCINYTGISFAGGPALIHYENGAPVNVTTPPPANTPPNTVCGTVTSLSPFAIFGQAAGAATATTVSSAVNPSVFGEHVTFSATVNPSVSTSLSPTGNVTFLDGGTTLGTAALSSGTATYDTSTLAVGVHSITAAYAGDTHFAASTSGAVSETISQGASSTSISASLNPVIVGQSVTLSATVSAVAPANGAPTGTVQFFDGAATLGPATLSGGRATFTTSALAQGLHSITAAYAGDGNFNGSTSPAVTLVVVLPTLTITANSVSRGYGQANPAFTVSYSGFVNGDTPAVLSGTLTCTSPATAASPVGTYPITCSGLASANYNIVYAPGVLTVAQAPLTVAANSFSRPYGAANPAFTGTVAGIQDGDNITATYSSAATPASPVGTYAIVPALVDPGGKLTNYAVTQNNGTLTVIQASTTTVLRVRADDDFGSSATLTAKISPVAPGAGTPTGNVTFLDGSTVLATEALSSADTATFSISSLGPGKHAFTASYGGDANFKGSVSPAKSPDE